MNDFYAKETSKNVKKTKNRKRKNDGFYYISQAPFGYKKIDVKGNLEIVEDQAKLIRRIYKEFKEGKGTYQIAQMLNREGILTPGLQMKLPVAVKNETPITKIWDCTQVRRILQNPVYIGSVFVMTAVMALFKGMGIWYPVYHVLSRGLLFGAFFMATDPVTNPTSASGRVIFY